MTTPALWTKIRLELRESAQPLQVLQAMAKRSGHLRLTVEIFDYVTRIDAFRDWTLFGAISNRIQSLDLRVSSQQLKDLAAVFPVFSSLEYLGINAVVTDELRVFNDAPLLRSIRLGNHDISRVHLPCKNITTLSASLYSINELVLILRALPNLRIFRGDQTYVGKSRERTNAHRPVVHKSLREVYLTEAANFDHLTLPNLEILEFQSWSSDLKTDFLDRALARASPPMRRMAFWPQLWMRTLILDSVDFLLHTPGLAELELNYPNDNTLSAFCDEFRERPSFLPEIRKLVLRCRQMSGSQIESHGQLFESAGEVDLATFVQCVLDATKYRIVGTPKQPAGQVLPFELRIIAEDNEHVGLVSLSEAQVEQCQEIQSRGVSLWIGPEDRNLVAKHC